MLTVALSMDITNDYGYNVTTAVGVKSITEINAKAYLCIYALLLSYLLLGYTNIQAHPGRPWIGAS